MTATPSPPSPARLIERLAKAAAGCTCVDDLVEHPASAHVLATLKERAPATYERSRDELCRRPDWGGRKPATFDRAVRKAASDHDRAKRATAHDGRIEVLYERVRVVGVADRVQEALSASGDGLDNRPVFAFADRACVLGRRMPKTVQQVIRGRRHRDYPAVPLVEQLDSYGLHERVQLSVRLLAPGKGGEPVEIPPPQDLLGILLSRRGRGLRPLVGIVETPLLGPDGALLGGNGYDPGTGLYLATGDLDVYAVPGAPAPADARAALRFLEEDWLAEFDLAARTDAAAAVAMLATAVQRKVLDIAPGFTIVAPVQGSGKTALADFVCRCAFGRPVPVAAWVPDNDEEMGKRLLAILVEAHPAVLFDNVKDGATVDSPEVAKALTNEAYSNRVLGRNETREAPTSVLVVFTGNNVAPSRDLASRLLEIRVEPRTDRPDARRFTRDLASWSQEHRPRVVGAVLTILRAHRLATTEAERRDRVRTRFPAWDMEVRQALLWAAGGDEAFDVARQFDRAVAASAGTDHASALLGTLWELFGEREFAAGEVAEKAAAGEAAAGFGSGDRPEERLAQALGGVGLRQATSQGVGLAMQRSVQGRVLTSPDGTWKLGFRHDARRKGWVYRFERIGPPGPGDAGG